MNRLLRMLVSLEIFEEPRRNIFRNSLLSTYLRTDNSRNVRAMILLHNSDPMSRPWFEYLEQGVREGTPPFILTHGEDLFSYFDHHPDFDQQFSAAMSSVEALSGNSFTTDFDWNRFKRIIDVGGSRGTKSLAILKQHPDLTALVVDRPQVIAEARNYWADHDADAPDVSNALKRMQFEAGDLLGLLPSAQSGEDIYLLSAVLHGFDDETCIRCLANLARASGSSGAPVALMELILPELGADPAGTAFDMQMFMGTRGRERTLSEWKSLFDRSGVNLAEVVDLRSFGKILVVFPAHAQVRGQPQEYMPMT